MSEMMMKMMMMQSKSSRWHKTHVPGRKSYFYAQIATWMMP